MLALWNIRKATPEEIDRAHAEYCAACKTRLVKPVGRTQIVIGRQRIKARWYCPNCQSHIE